MYQRLKSVLLLFFGSCLNELLTMTMRFLSSFFTMMPRDPRPPMDTRLVGPRVILRLPLPSDWSRWRHLRSLSHDFLKPWEPAWPLDSLSRVFFDGVLRRHMREWRQGVGYAFLIFAKKEKDSSPLVGEVRRGGVPTGAGLENKKLFQRHSPHPNPPHEGEGILIGGINLNDVRRGVAQKGTLGYWIGQPYAGQGLMTEAAALVCDFAFRDLKLHRVEASCLPHNEPSKRLLQRLGFAEEGYAKSYLRIDNEWQDHLLWGRTER